ncbi:MAG: carboxylating nicotinate-nucleotide diphosphorylase [Candidatus Geothermarchaeales archaeon]
MKSVDEYGDIIERALIEDRCDEDITTNAIVPASYKARGVIYAKEDGIIAGLDVAKAVFGYEAPDINFEYLARDGDRVSKGQGVAEIDGSARIILTRERVALNFLQHLSGIATTVNKYVRAAGKTKILDTRKTTPGLRRLEKYAVRVGGGHNHRMDLREMILIKDNHIAIVGNIKKAVALARKTSDRKIEVETKTLEEVREAVEAKPDRIMLDNMPLETMKDAMKIIKNEIEVEASGGMSLERIPEVAKLNVDYISVGALTHSVKALDISLEILEIHE